MTRRRENSRPQWAAVLLRVAGRAAVATAVATCNQPSGKWLEQHHSQRTEQREAGVTLIHAVLVFDWRTL